MDSTQDHDGAVPARRGRIALLAGCAMAVAAFGPYTSVAGVRTEQVVVYGVGAAALLSTRWTGMRLSRAAVLVATLLAGEIVIAVVGTLVPVVDLSPYVVGSVLPGLDNLILPLVVLASVWTLLAAGADRDRLLRVACRVVVLAMCANTVVAYLSQLHDLTPLLARFWDNTVDAGDASTGTVAGNAAQLGRFTGVFNQPAEAGEMYSIALLAAIYLYRAKSVRLVLAGLLLGIGGVLTISKVFLLVGLPIAVWQLLRVSTQRGRRLTLLATGIFAVAALAESGIGPDWIGGGFLDRLLHPGDSSGLLDLYTGGRIGGVSSLHLVSDAVLHNSPWFGYGAGGLAAPYDNGWIEALAVAGLFGVALYTGILLVLAAGWLRRHALMSEAQARLAGGLIVLAAGASVGLPALTANRVATVMWLLLALVLLSEPLAVPRAVPVEREVPVPVEPAGVRSGVGAHAA
ncbi:hypothetical protein GCM10023322_10450 [Rugosimonospora acidiphila]|uniref:O-antigen ligase n=1 Tax=Rugosimonospora acidiphila TaxID=556531 RepID=A0ABP9RKT7_9ACTN